MLTKLEKIGSWNTCLFHFYKGLLTDFGGCFEFCKSIGIRKGVVLQEIQLEWVQWGISTISVEFLESAIAFLGREGKLEDRQQKEKVVM